MADCKPCSTPCEMDIKKTSDEVNLINSQPNREIIDSLIYIMVATRLDICYTVTRLSQDLAKLNSFHLTEAKHVLCHLKGTINQSLIFKKLQKPLKLEGFCDADWANISDRKITSWFCFKFAENNLKSKKQNSVALSTCKAEFIANSLTSQEALYLKALLRTMMELESLKNPTFIHCDNQSSIVLTKNPVVHQRSKNSVYTWWNKLRVHSFRIHETEKNVADVITRPMTGIKLNTFRKIVVDS